jgi:hypothetical protein
MATFKIRVKELRDTLVKNVVDMHFESNEKNITGSLELPKEIANFKEGSDYQMILTTISRPKEKALLSMKGTIYLLNPEGKKWLCTASFGGFQFRLSYTGKLGLERTADLYLQLTAPVKKKSK